MWWPAFRSQSDALRALVIGVGLCWSVAFVLVALVYRLELYADGAMFSYAVAVQDVWAFHWHNISSRASVFLLTLLPAEIYVGLSGDPRAGVFIYGLLFYLAPLAGLIGTFAADRSSGRIIFLYACCSTALLCPLIFGFPTEMWLAHAMFWPTLAVSHYAKRTVVGSALAFLMFLALAFTHEGALVLEFSIVATLAMRGLRDASFLRAAAILIVVLAACAAVKIIIPPDEYYADVLLRAALHFFDIKIFEVNIVALLFGTMVLFSVLIAVFSRLTPERAHLYAAAMVVGLLVIPGQVALIPLLRAFSGLQINGTFLALWLVHTGFGLSLAIYLLYNYISQLPREILESAFIDGASQFTIFPRLILPLSVPALASFAIFQFMWVWNDYLNALIFLGTTPEQQVMTIKLAQMLGSRGQAWYLLTAGGFVSMLLPLVVFFSLQRFFVRGLLAGSVKG